MKLNFQDKIIRLEATDVTEAWAIGKLELHLKAYNLPHKVLEPGTDGCVGVELDLAPPQKPLPRPPSTLETPEERYLNAKDQLVIKRPAVRPYRDSKLGDSFIGVGSVVRVSDIDHDYRNLAGVLFKVVGFGGAATIAALTPLDGSDGRTFNVPVSLLVLMEPVPGESIDDTPAELTMDVFPTTSEDGGFNLNDFVEVADTIPSRAWEARINSERGDDESPGSYIGMKGNITRIYYVHHHQVHFAEIRTANGTIINWPCPFLSHAPDLGENNAK